MDNNETAGRRLAFTLYTGATHTAGTVRTSSWGKFTEVFSQFERRTAKDGRAFTPYPLREGFTRSNAGAEYFSMAVADIDDGVTLDELFPHIEHLEWFAHSSFSHTDGHHKFRLIFPLSRDVYPPEWSEFRTGFHTLLQGHVDPATKDLGRFYYMPSALPDAPVFVRSNRGTWLDPETMFNRDTVETPAGPARTENEFAGAPRAEFPPSSLVQAAERCAQLANFRDTGCADEPTWYNCIGVAKLTTDGAQLVHEWGSKYRGYDKAETDRKFDQWAYGPTSCDKFKACNPTLCANCAFSETITSPIQLGYTVETEVPVVEDDSSGGAQEIEFWPKGFRVTADGTIQCMVPDKDGVTLAVRVASPLFYLDERIQLDDGTYAYTIRMEVRKNKWRSFELPAKYLADLRSFKSVLASYEVIVHHDKIIQAFVNEQAAKLRQHRDEINTFKQFGWVDGGKGFLIGGELVHAEGRTPVRVSQEVIRAPELLEASLVKGAKDAWSYGVQELYDRPNGEPYQYAICTQFGAPLVPMLEYEEWNGIPMALTSDRSGLGKSTVCKVGINALCNSAKTTVADSTAKAIIGRASAMNNLPVLFDEVTNSLKDPIELGNTLYSLSNGRPRIGMQSDGRERVPAPPYRLNSSLTGNKNVMFQLTETKTNPEAMQMRVFEIALEDYPIMDSMRDDSELHAKHHELALDLVNNHYGVWADAYFKFVIENRAMLTEKLHKTAVGIVKSLGGGAAKERFYAYHMACTLVGGWVAKKIGAVGFDLNNLKHWAFEHILKMRQNAQELAATTDDALSKMLTDMHGHILVTKHYEGLSAAANPEVPIIQIRGEVKARLVLGSDKERPKLFVAVRAVDEWCTQNNQAPAKFKRELAASGALRAGGENGRKFDKRISLGRGVPSHPTGQCRCLEIDYKTAQGYIEDFVEGKVLHLSRAVSESVSVESEQAA